MYLRSEFFEYYKSIMHYEYLFYALSRIMVFGRHIPPSCRQLKIREFLLKVMRDYSL